MLPLMPQQVCLVHGAQTFGINVDFTREPIIETVITPKEGCMLVVRSSKNSGQEEYFVDSVEVVCFGNSFFFRSRERPKSFLVPVSDYEIVEVRETRLVLKNVAFDRSIKIGGGREAPMRAGRETAAERTIIPPEAEGKEKGLAAVGPTEEKTEGRLDKKRERRRNYKRKRQELALKEEPETEATFEAEKEEPALPPAIEEEAGMSRVVTSVLSSLLPPPTSLISETIARYKDNALFKGAFFIKGEGAEEQEPPFEPPTFTEQEDEEIKVPTISLEQPRYGMFEASEEEEEQIYQQRRSQRLAEKGEKPQAEAPPPSYKPEKEPSENHPEPENSYGEENEDPFPF